MVSSVDAPGPAMPCVRSLLDADPAFLQVRRTLLQRHPALPEAEPLDEEWLLDRHHHPFYRAAIIRFFVAERAGTPLGRAAAILNEEHNRTWNAADAFLGFFEAESQDVAHQLISAVATWSAARGATRLLATANPSPNYSTGLQTSGFEHKPTLLVNPSPEHYPRFLEAAGFSEMVSWRSALLARLDMPRLLPEINPFLQRMLRSGARLRPLRFADRSVWSEPVRRVYNDSFQASWGFVPFDAREFEAYLSRLEKHWSDELSLGVEVDGALAGFVSTVVPPKGAPSGPGHVLFLCVARRFQKHLKAGGLGIGLAAAFITAFADHHLEEVEFHFNEESQFMARLADLLRATPNKRYAFYQMDIGS